MRIGMYIMTSLMLIILVGVYVYTINDSIYSLNLFGINVPLPVAAWVAIAMGALLVASVLHMMFYGAKGFFARKKWSKDAVGLEDAAYYALLNEPRKRSFSVSEIRSGASILSISSLDAKGVTKGLSEKLASTVTWINDIKSGKYVDLKSKKVHKIMSSDNPIVIQNNINRIKEQPMFAETILTNSTKYNDSVVSASFAQMVSTESMYKLRKYANRMNTSDLYTLLERADSGEEIGLSVDNIKAIIKELNLQCKDYIRLAKSTVGKLSPDENLGMFKKFAARDEKAENAYIYIMFQYEMLDGIKHIFEENDEEKFRSYKLLYELKKDNRNYKIDEVVNVDLICNEH